MYFYCRPYTPQQLNVVTYFLKECQYDPNASNISPLSVARDDEIIRVLIKYGASPPYEKWKKYLPGHSDSQFQPKTKSFVLGNPGAGKSTLVKSLVTESKGLARFISRVIQVSGVDQRTAGIIPHDFYSERFGHLTMYDFAGHSEFYASHDALLRNAVYGSPSAVFFLVADMRETDDSFRASIQYWLNFAENQYQSIGSQMPHVIIVGSHADKVPLSVAMAKESVVMSLSTKFRLAGFIALDCRFSESSSMSKLRSLFAESCEAVKATTKLAFRNHCFLVYLLDKFGNKPAVSLSSVFLNLSTAISVIEGPAAFLPDDLSQIALMCEKLSAQGSILFMKNESSVSDSWVVLDKATLLSNVNGTIFAPEGFKEHCVIATSTGIVPYTKLASQFPELDSDMIIKYLCHLEFCQEVSDRELVSIIETNYNFPSSKERFFFFPGLVRLDPPKGVWGPSDQFGYHSGWLLECSKQEQFLNPRFLQILILRSAFSFALAPSRAQPLTQDLPTLQRQCSVWKNGISWRDRSGLQSLIEITDQKQVILLVRCPVGREAKLLKLRAALIQLVLNVSCQLVPNTSFNESIFHPKVILEYPVTDFSKVSLTEVASTVVAGEQCLLWNECEVGELEHLLYFEPFAGMDYCLLRNFFDDNLCHTMIDDSFVTHLADKVFSNVDKFVTILEPSAVELSHCNPQDDVQKMLCVLRLWKVKMGEKSTYYNLRSELEKFSIFAGRNPLVCIISLECIERGSACTSLHIAIAIVTVAQP